MSDRAPLGLVCEPVHGEECEDSEVLLPDDDEILLDLGDVLSLVYRAPDGQIWEHTFTDPPGLLAWREGIIINTPVDETGLEG